MPFGHRLAGRGIPARNGQHHDAFAGAFVVFITQEGFLDVVPVASVRVAATHVDVIRLADHLVANPRGHDDHVAGANSDPGPAAFTNGNLKFHPTVGAAEAFVRGGMKMSVFVNPRIVPVV